MVSDYTTTYKSRDDYWDTLKLFLMFLVIYAHSIASFAPDGSTNRKIYSIIYFFHMPLFVFISGRFSQIRDKNKYIKNIISLLGTFLLFQLIWRVVPEFIEYRGGQISLLKYFQRILCPGYTLWYLLSMVFWRLTVLVTPKSWQQRPINMIVLSIFVCLLSGYMPLNSELSFQRTLSFLPFFIVGFCSNKIDLKRMIRKIPLLIAIIVFVVFSLLICKKFNTNLDYITYCNRSYWNMSGESFVQSLALRLLYLLVAALLCIMFMRLSYVIKSFSNWGRKTLFIYVWHSFLVKYIEHLVMKGFLPDNTFLFVVYSLIIISVLLALSNVHFLNKIMNPIEWFSSKYK